MQRIISLYCLARKLGLALALIGIGYLLGNAFPTFEVVPHGFTKRLADPLSLAPMVGAMEDFNDEVQ